ncbi:hypothetical protein HMN09_00615700 [Mycena chlorophos]|uniref:Uncharacterized protein n=1 Tax=Mycena chlorophos TaxID=658473 RepID=A0A8H6WAD5_MYCCL|nr:hypothetical protein HMN09_00615700 [Mycena chlorophos]
MSLPSPDPSGLLVTSPDQKTFTPRREFQRDISLPNSFSLVALAGPNLLKCFSFPLPVLTSLRRLLDQLELITNVREDIENQVCEFSLGGRPWASAKSHSTELIIVSLLRVIMHDHGYQLLSTIDYGRENDDRLAIAFARPLTRATSLSPVDSPIPTSLSSSSKQDRRIPFALSFTSQTTLRVIAPPLHSTPAILQAVRGAWPRGVVAEKKVGDHCFEFKLKGYKWFHEDTFATDSLRHILSLLSSLDAHSFSLVASFSLTGRSRVKDLWIFTGPASTSMDSFPDSPTPSILNGSYADIRRVAGSPLQLTSSPSGQSQHRRMATDPSPSSGFAMAQAAHMRAATESPGSVSSSRSDRRQSLLRKPAPRAQIPVSVHDTDPPVAEPTGAARTPDVFYSTSPLRHTPPSKEEPFPLLLPVDDASSHTPSSQERASSHNPPSLGSHSQSQSPSPAPSPQPAVTPPIEELSEFPSKESPAGTPPILSPNAFRDSTMSTASNSTLDMPIPIKWTGLGRDPVEENRESDAPAFPGGWQPTPIDEKPETFEGNLPTPEIQEVSARNSPDHQSPDVELRKSEAGLVGLIAASETTQPASEGKGWVVVDVDKGDETSTAVSPTSEPQSPAPPKQEVSPKSETPSGTGTPTPISPAARAIAVVDAIESKNKSSSSSTTSSTAPDSGAKKFFSVKRKDSSRQAPSATPTKGVSEDDTKRAIELVASNTKQKTSKPSLLGRLRRKGTPEASRIRRSSIN